MKLFYSFVLMYNFSFFCYLWLYWQEGFVIIVDIGFILVLKYVIDFLFNLK